MYIYEKLSWSYFKCENAKEIIKIWSPNVQTIFYLFNSQHGQEWLKKKIEQ